MRSRALKPVLPPSPARPPPHPSGCLPLSAEGVVVAQTRAQCYAAAYDTHNVVACYGADGGKYYRRGNTQTSIPPPHWLRFARLGQSSAQQVSNAHHVEHAWTRLPEPSETVPGQPDDVAAPTAAADY